MKTNFIAASITIGLALMSNTTEAADGSLTIYSGDYDSVAQSEASSGGPGFALFERKIGFDLKTGDNEVSLGGLPRGMDSSSLVLRPDGNAKVRGQRFDFAIAGQDELLRRALGQTVTVEQAVGNDPNNAEHSVTLANATAATGNAAGGLKMLDDLAVKWPGNKSIKTARFFQALWRHDWAAARTALADQPESPGRAFACIDGAGLNHFDDVAGERAS